MSSEQSLEFATQLGVSVEIIHHPEQSGKATQDAATILQVDPSLILRMLNLVNKRTNQPIGLRLRGDEKIDNASVKKSLGTKHFRFANDDEVEDITGHQVGGIPPTVVTRCDYRFASHRILEDEYFYGSGGTEYFAMKISADEIAALPGVTVAKITTRV